VGGGLGLEVVDEADPPLGRLVRGGGSSWLDVASGYGSGCGHERLVVSGPGGQGAAVGAPLDGIGVDCDGGDASRVVVVGQLSARVGGPQQWLLLEQAEQDGLIQIVFDLLLARTRAEGLLVPLYLSTEGAAELS